LVGSEKVSGGFPRLPSSFLQRARTHAQHSRASGGRRNRGHVLIPLGTKKGMSEKGGLGRLSAADSSFSVVLYDIAI
jgi:hypothetical protein